MAGDRNLELDGISKRSGDVVALDQLSLEAPAGELFGLVGRNGAGKTTAMRIVVACSRPMPASLGSGASR